MGRRGESYIATVSLLLALLTVLSVLWVYAVALVTGENVRAAVEREVDSFLVNSSVELYDVIKRGESDSMKPYLKKLRSKLQTKLGRSLAGGEIEGSGVHGRVYRIRDLTVTETKTMKVRVSYTLLIPLNFCGQPVFWLPISCAATGDFVRR